MKRIKAIIISLTALVLLGLQPGCKKYNEYPSHVAQVSFPTVTLNGPQFMTINRGGTFTDPGATWKDTVTGESGTLTMTINTSKDSAYFLVYTATNKNGFQNQVTVFRGVGVTNYNGPIDISGNYADNAGGTDSIQMVSRALFFHPNVDLYGDVDVMAIKSDSTLSVAVIKTLVTGTTGAPIPVTFTGTLISYTSPISFQYTVTILNVPPYVAQFQHE
jgi:hypothetical protein